MNLMNMEFFLHMKCKCLLSRYDDIVLHKKHGVFHYCAELIILVFCGYKNEPYGTIFFVFYPFPGVQVLFPALIASSKCLELFFRFAAFNSKMVQSI